MQNSIFKTNVFTFLKFKLTFCKRMFVYDHKSKQKVLSLIFHKLNKREMLYSIFFFPFTNQKTKIHLYEYSS